MNASRALGLAIAQLTVAPARGQSLPTFSAHDLLDAHNSGNAENDSLFADFGVPIPEAGPAASHARALP
jgi:hypothetical protein